MKRKLMLSLVAVALALGAASPEATATDWCSGGVCQEWVARYDAPPGNGYEWAYDIAVDPSGNVYVTGQSSPSGAMADYATIKYGPDGGEEWVARYDGPAGSHDYAYAVAVDSWGNVYVTGESDAMETDSHYATIKYGPDGTQEWLARYDGPAGNNDVAFALAVDGPGNVYVTGGSFGLGGSFDYVTIKYRPDGSEEWVARYDGPAGRSDWALDLAVDAAGNVYVTGYSYMSSRYDADYTTIKYAPDGSQEWLVRYDGPVGDWDEARALALDASGNVYVTGWSGPWDADSDYATVKYRPDGTEEWVGRYNGTAGREDRAWDVGVDGSGNVYVTGESGSSGGSDYATVKYAPDGSEQWVARYDGLATGDYDVDAARALAVDFLGNVYVTGKSAVSPSEVDYVTLKYRPDGSQEWVAGYEGSGGTYDEARALAVDLSGNAYVTGQSWGSESSYDYATVKYAPDIDGDGLPGSYEDAHACLDTTVPDAGADPDADWLTNLQEYRGVDGTPGTGDETDPCVNDSDRDGCADGEEPAGAPEPKPGATGAFDPLAWHDFYDVPVTAEPDPAPNGSKDEAVTMGDVLAVLLYVGTFDGGPANPNGVAYDSVKGSCDWDADTVSDKEGVCYDRSPSAEPNPPWEAGPPSGVVNMPDVLTVLAQVGLDCSGPP